MRLKCRLHTVDDTIRARHEFISALIQDFKRTQRVSQSPIGLIARYILFVLVFSVYSPFHFLQTHLSGSNQKNCICLRSLRVFRLSLCLTRCNRYRFRLQEKCNTCNTAPYTLLNYDNGIFSRCRLYLCCHALADAVSRAYNNCAAGV